jgi:hypothetical protein
VFFDALADRLHSFALSLPYRSFRQRVLYRIYGTYWSIRKWHPNRLPVHVDWHPWKKDGLGCLSISVGRYFIGYRTTFRVYVDWPLRFKFDSDHLVVWARKYLTRLGGTERVIEMGDSHYWHSPDTEVRWGPFRYLYCDTDFGGCEKLEVFGIQLGFYV